MNADNQDRDEQARRYLSLEDVSEDVELPEPAPARPVENRRRRDGARKGPIAAGVVAVLAVAGVAVGRAIITNDHRSSPAAVSSTTTQAPTEPSVTSTPSTSTSSATVPRSTPAAPASARVDAAQVAERFVREVVNTHRSQQDWDTAISKLCTADYADRVALTDPSEVPAQHVTGHGHVENIGTDEPVATVFVPTSAEGYTVTLIASGTHWQVMNSAPGQTAE